MRVYEWLLVLLDELLWVNWFRVVLILFFDYTMHHCVFLTQRLIIVIVVHQAMRLVLRVEVHLLLAFVSVLQVFVSCSGYVLDVECIKPFF